MNATPNRRFDPVTLEILWSRLISIADESAAALLRTAFSTVVRESNDFTTVLLDAECNCLAENTGGIPSFVGMVPSTVKAMLDRIPVERWGPDDCIITNDPWLGSGHLPDVTMASPIFHRGKLVGFSGSIAHLPDIGGAGWACDTRELYEEGLRLMPVKFIENDAESEIVGDIIRANVRVPDQVIGDLYAQVAAQRICQKGLQQFLDDTGLPDLTELSAELRGRAETAMRKAIAALPDGSWSAVIDADGIDEFETRIACRMTVSGSDIELDFEGTSQQVACGINSVMKYTYAYATYPIKCALDPDSPRNEGSFPADHGQGSRGVHPQPDLSRPGRGPAAHRPSALRRHLSLSRPDRTGQGRCRVGEHPDPAVRLRRRGPDRQPVQPGAVRGRRTGGEPSDGRIRLHRLSLQHRGGQRRGAGERVAAAGAAQGAGAGLRRGGQVPGRPGSGRGDRGALGPSGPAVGDVRPSQVSAARHPGRRGRLVHPNRVPRRHPAASEGARGDAAGGAAQAALSGRRRVRRSGGARSGRDRGRYREGICLGGGGTVCLWLRGLRRRSMRNCERGVATRAALGNYRFLSKYTSINCVAQHLRHRFVRQQSTW